MKPATLLLSGAALLFAAPAFPVYAQDPFPSVDQATQKARDDTRWQILQDELATEKKSFDGAQQALTDATNAKQPTAKLDALRQEADRHAKNVDALNGELTALSRQPATVPASSAVRLQGRAINNSPSDATQLAPCWDVYQRTQVKADDEPETLSSPSGSPTIQAIINKKSMGRNH